MKGSIFHSIKDPAAKAICATSLLLAVTAPAFRLSAQTVYTWRGGTGNWGDLDWDPTVPNDATADVYIDGGKTAVNSVVTLNNNYTVGRLTIDAGDTLNTNDGTTLTVAAGAFAGSGTVATNGTLNVNGGYYGSSLYFNGPGSLTGTGTLNLNSSSSYVYSNNSLLTVGAGFTVAGTGNLGANQTSVLNNGTVSANQNGGVLNVQTGSTFTNAGTLRATDGGILQLNGGTFTGGAIQALDASSVNLTNNPTLSATTLTTAGTGAVVNTNSATLANVTNNGTFNANNGTNTYLTGTLTNNGVVNVNGGYYNTNAILNGPVTLAGTGTLNLNSTNAGLYAANGGDRLTINAGATLAGQGNVGFGQTTVLNHGLVDANVAGATLVLQPGGGNATFANGANGVAQASNEATLQLAGNNGGTFTGGTFQALDGSTVALANNALVTAATLTTVGSGAVVNTNNATLANVVNAGTFNASNGTNTYLSGTLTNNGTFNVLGGYYNTNAITVGPTTLAGTGTFNLANNGQNAYLYAQNNGDLITVGANQTIVGGGNLGYGQTTFANNGLVNATTGTLTIQPGGGNATFANGGTGLAQASNGATLQLAGNNGGVFTGGKFQALDGSQVALANNPTLTNTTLATAGTGTVVNTNSATLANVTNNGTLVASNGTNTYLSGTLTNNSTFTVIGGYYNTNVQLAGPVTIAGTGTFNLANNGQNVYVYAQNPGDRLTIGDNQTVSGGGNLGDGQTTFTNRGVVNATGGTLTIQPGGTAASGADFTNAGAGVAQASGGATIQLAGNNGGTFTGGAFRALDNGTVALANNPILTNTTLATVGSGAVVNTNTATLANVTNNGTLVANNSTTTYLNGTLTNNATFTVTGGYYSTNVILNSPTTLAGTGTVNLANSGQNVFVYAANNGDRLTVGANQTIVGGGNLGYGQTTFTNNGLLNANGGTLTLQPGGGTADFTNAGTGLAQASNGGTLQLAGNNGGVFTGGTFQALDGSVVRLDNNANLRATTLATAGTGVVNAFSATLTDVTNNGALVTPNGNTTALAGTLTNNGTYTVTGGYYGTNAVLNGPVTLAGTGTLNLGAGGGNAYLYAQTPGDRLTIAPGATLAGNGSLGYGQTTFTNNGTVNANVSGATLLVQPGGSSGDFTTGPGGLTEATGGGVMVQTGGTFTNNGTYAVVSGASGGGSSLSVAAGQLTNYVGTTLTGGTYHVLSTNTAATSTLSLGGGTITTNAARVTLSGASTVFSEINGLAANQGTFAVANGRNFTTVGALANSGVLIAAGGSTLTVNGGLTQSSSGTLTGAGTFVGAFQLAGNVNPGGTVDAATGVFADAAGTTTLTGATAFDVGAQFHFELGSTLATNDHLTINGALNLNGTLNVAALPGFGPGIYDLIDFPALQRSGAGLALGSLPAGYTYALLYLPDQVDLAVSQLAVPEPSTWAALLGGGAGFMVVLRRRVC